MAVENASNTRRIESDVLRPESLRPAPTPAPTQQYHRIMIFGDEDNTRDVEVWINGKSLFIRRNMEAIIPEEMLKVLKDAKAPLFYTGHDGRTYATPDQPRYRMSERGPATREEYEKMLSERRVISDDEMPQVTEIQRNLQQAIAYASSL